MGNLFGSLRSSEIPIPAHGVRVSGGGVSWGEKNGVHSSMVRAPGHTYQDVAEM